MTDPVVETRVRALVGDLNERQRAVLRAFLVLEEASRERDEEAAVLRPLEERGLLEEWDFGQWWPTPLGFAVANHIKEARDE